MSSSDPATTTGSGREQLARELHAKADFGVESLPEKPAKLDLRVAALANCAALRANGGDKSPTIGARYQASRGNSPVKTSSTTASETLAPEPHILLRRQNSATLSTGTVVPRSSRSTSPTKRSTAAVLERYRSLVGVDAGNDNNGDDEEEVAVTEPCGLDFLLQACDILEPGNSKARSRGAVRRALADAEPANSQGSRGTARRAQRRRSNEDGDYTPAGSSGDEEYKPTTRSGRTSRRTAAASAAIRAATEHTGAPSGGGARWERGCVAGPCMNPDCDNPHESPQWRKGPPACPVLCNACGTRWLRNGSLKPLVPRRGIRYHRAHPRANNPRSRGARGQPAPAPAAAYQDEEEEEEPYYEEEEAPAARPAAAAAPAPVAAAPAAALPPAADAAPAPLTFDPAAMQQMAAALAAHAQQAQREGVPATLPMEWLHAATMFAPPAAAGFGGGAAAAALQQQVAAMGAAAQAAQQAMAAAAIKEATKPAGPVFHIQAVAGPRIPAPAFVAAPQPAAPLPKSPFASEEVLAAAAVPVLVEGQ